MTSNYPFPLFVLLIFVFRKFKKILLCYYLYIGLEKYKLIKKEQNEKKCIYCCCIGI
ncbi:hypothetical protein M125_0637 [Bacteroides fragilis str. 3998T(B)3]|uniref:Transmembrane protein n=1 Tax=Bacteroides fragilis str. 3998T(B)3 TaxID=1339316 RepID=A0A015XJ54_BACFG|nr:hypothetical protein M125_0637 [Bacteroides fragilis str. 3998T(B)3]